MAGEPVFIRKYKYTVHITGFFMFAVLVCLVGGIFTVKGLFNLYGRAHVKSFYDSAKIHTGNYVQYDISREQILGKFYTEVSGEEKYGPLCVVDAWTSERRYIVAPDGSRADYIVLSVSALLRPQLQKLVDGEIDTYHIYGKIRRLRHGLQYDTIAEYIGNSDPDILKQMISGKHEIRVTDPEKRESMWYKGFLFWVMGLCGVLRGVERKALNI